MGHFVRRINYTRRLLDAWSHCADLRCSNSAQRPTYRGNANHCVELNKFDPLFCLYGINYQREHGTRELGRIRKISWFKGSGWTPVCLVMFFICKGLSLASLGYTSELQERRRSISLFSAWLLWSPQLQLMLWQVWVDLGEGDKFGWFWAFWQFPGTAPFWAS